MATDVLAVLCTFPSSDEATSAGRALVEEGLAACANLCPGVTSVYRWQGQVVQDQEVLAIIKTRADLFQAMRARLVALHSYDVPEVIALPVVDGHEPYLDWLRSSTRGSSA